MAAAVFKDETIEGSVPVVAVGGELDLASASELRRRVDAALREGGPGTVVDLTEVTHMDSSGLAALIVSHQRATELNERLVLVLDSPTVRRTLEIRGVIDLFTVVHTRDEGLALLGVT